MHGLSFGSCAARGGRSQRGGMSDDPYLWPGTAILRNKLGILDAELLDYHERELVTQRIRQGVLGGNFDLRHLQAIHLHLFQDIYD